MRQLKKAKRYKTNTLNFCALIYNQTVVLSFMMKLLLLVLVLLFCFLNSVNGLKCYECTNLDDLDSCEQTKVTTCGPDESQKYCLKADYERVDEDQFRYCNGNCTYKGCIEKEYEKFCESGTFDISQAISEWKGTAYCCEGNMCNSEIKCIIRTLTTRRLETKRLLVLPWFHYLVANLRVQQIVLHQFQC